MTCSSSRYAPVQRQALSRRRSSEPCALRGALARCEAALWNHKSECVAAKLVRVSEGRLRGARGGRYAPKARDAPRASRRGALAAASACFGDHRLVLRHASVRWKLSCAEDAASVAPCLRGARRRANFPLVEARHARASAACSPVRRMRSFRRHTTEYAPVHSYWGVGGGHRRISRRRALGCASRAKRAQEARKRICTALLRLTLPQRPTYPYTAPDMHGSRPWSASRPQPRQVATGWRPFELCPRVWPRALPREPRAAHAAGHPPGRAVPARGAECRLRE